jgi:hypothetical protein
MNLTIETKVAAAVASGFVALTMCVIGQENSGGGTDAHNRYGPTNNSELSFMSSQGLQGSKFGRTTTEDDQTTITTHGASEER